MFSGLSCKNGFVMRLLNWICGTTTLIGFRHRKNPMGTWVDYYCSACGHDISLPAQQRGFFCYLCGARVSKNSAEGRKRKGNKHHG